MDDAERDARDAELLRVLADAPLLTEQEINALYRRPDTSVAAAELAALLCASHGLTVQMTAATLGKDVDTVKSQLARVRYKLHAKNTTHACCLALRLGLLD